MIIGISIPWYEIPCSYGMAINVIPQNTWFKQETNVMENNPVHLCNSCCKSYPECSDNEHIIEFGDGIGNDNICCCNKYKPLMEHDYDRGGYK